MVDERLILIKLSLKKPSLRAVRNSNRVRSEAGERFAESMFQVTLKRK